MSSEHRQIITLYNSVLNGFLNYYKFVHNYGRLVSRLFYELRFSCAKLLAAKYTLRTVARVFEKFGSNLEIKHIDGKNKEKSYSFKTPSYKVSQKFLVNVNHIIPTLYGNISLASLDNLVCAVCESDYRVEMHHVRLLKDLNPKLDVVDKLMASRKRKQIPLCRLCHMTKHRSPSEIKGFKLNQKSFSKVR